MAVEDFTPTPADVAGHMRARLKDKFKEVEEFSTETRPTKAQIEALIPKAVRVIASRIGTTICEGEHQETLYGDAKELAALRVAMLAERSYFPEQVGTGRSPYELLREEWKEGIKVLMEAISEHCGSGGAGGDAIGGAGVLPKGNFPGPSEIGSEVW